MRTKLAVAGLTLALSIGGIALAPATSAVTGSSVARAATATVPSFFAGGTWMLYQSNGPVVTLNLTQDGSGQLYGSASCCGSVVGTIEYGAAVDGTSISFTIAWSNGSRGRYTGSLGADRRLSGFTFDLNNPSSQATWSTSRVF
ncbi:hypothetical protein [Streptomyces violascens]|uniref:Uncharacterized protein n=1 Tax=Streptomyces violascens TaxID=67381 RepID=A0ABQ3QTS2_9ACTN|nr:hypothetical protein [Streptomyces violascens]GHI40660.1 hypothetical protein Sviol_50680 [Streptomyces violascens]